MKLRNKKTGEVIILIDHIFDNYSSLAELNEDWEDYQPAEPLIKDKKIRKAVRAWAEANRIKEDSYKDSYEDRMLEFDRGEHRLKWIETSIEFNEAECLEGLEDGEKYTIAELCGEEEE